MVRFVEACIVALFQSAAILFQELSLSVEVVPGVVEGQDGLVEGLDVLLELLVEAVPELPVAGGRNVHELLSGAVEVPREPFLKGGALDVLQDVQLFLGPVGPACGLVVLPQPLDGGVRREGVVRGIVSHCDESG